MTVMNSPWDPRYEDAFYLGINADKNYNFFKDVTEAQQFVENPKSEGKGVVFHVLPIQTMFSSIPQIPQSETVSEPTSEAPEAEVLTPEVTPETPTEQTVD